MTIASWICSARAPELAKLHTSVEKVGERWARRRSGLGQQKAMIYLWQIVGRWRTASREGER